MKASGSTPPGGCKLLNQMKGLGKVLVLRGRLDSGGLHWWFLCGLQECSSQNACRAFHADEAWNPSPELFQKGFWFLLFEKCFADLGLTRSRFRSRRSSTNHRTMGFIGRTHCLLRVNDPEAVVCRMGSEPTVPTEILKFQNFGCC